MSAYIGSENREWALEGIVETFLCWNVLWSLFRADDSSVDHDDMAFAGELPDLNG